MHCAFLCSVMKEQERCLVLKDTMDHQVSLVLTSSFAFSFHIISHQTFILLHTPSHSTPHLHLHILHHTFTFYISLHLHILYLTPPSHSISHSTLTFYTTHPPSHSTLYLHLHILHYTSTFTFYTTPPPSHSTSHLLTLYTFL